MLHTTYPPSPESLKTLTEKRLQMVAAMPPSLTMFKAVDTATGKRKIIGAARWTVCEEDEEVDCSVDEDMQKALGLAIPETDVAVTRAFYTMALEGKRGIGFCDGDPGEEGMKLWRRVELETIFTHPGFQRQGVGSALLSWGIGEAERLGVMVYLEATEQGRLLYERFGFDGVKVVDFDAADYWWEGRHTYTFMVREPRGVRG
ncbi:hypothetical protein BDW59DRAFT_162608 [Aspergillus cavernicola]|uniref:N-acetyltransferase domain-containing protein n=1 Tax=Aspergillus cavernicola TaxID=176166 RepID=A0ABR4I962_9EURO